MNKKDQRYFMLPHLPHNQQFDPVQKKAQSVYQVNNGLHQMQLQPNIIIKQIPQLLLPIVNQNLQTQQQVQQQVFKPFGVIKQNQSKENIINCTPPKQNIILKQFQTLNNKKSDSPKQNNNNKEENEESRTHRIYKGLLKYEEEYKSNKFRLKVLKEKINKFLTKESIKFRRDKNQHNRGKSLPNVRRRVFKEVSEENQNGNENKHLQNKTQNQNANLEKISITDVRKISPPLQKYMRNIRQNKVIPYEKQEQSDKNVNKNIEKLEQLQECHEPKNKIEQLLNRSQKQANSHLNKLFQSNDIAEKAITAKSIRVQNQMMQNKLEYQKIMHILGDNYNTTHAKANDDNYNQQQAYINEQQQQNNDKNHNHSSFDNEYEIASIQSTNRIQQRDQQRSILKQSCLKQPTQHLHYDYFSLNNNNINDYNNTNNKKCQLLSDDKHSSDEKTSTFSVSTSSDIIHNSQYQQMQLQETLHVANNNQSKRESTSSLCETESSKDSVMKIAKYYFPSRQKILQGRYQEQIGQDSHSQQAFNKKESNKVKKVYLKLIDGKHLHQH